ncbi:type 1 glutamine amidotransferase domain-containing protein, partial [Pectobacterium parvum]|nr:type 1 glutamine amidotransferase domain-containing protein [Pectobacterium parvum]
MSIIKRCAGLIAAMAVFAAASPVFAQNNLKEEKVLIVVSSLDKKTKKKTTQIEVFDKVGLSYDIASPKDGMTPFDGFDLQEQATLNFLTHTEHRHTQANS